MNKEDLIHPKRKEEHLCFVSPTPIVRCDANCEECLFYKVFMEEHKDKLQNN